MGASGKGIGGVLPYAGAAAGGYAQGIQNKRQLEQGERQLLLQEAENEMRRRGLALDEQRVGAEYGPASAEYVSSMGQAAGAPNELMAGLTGKPVNQVKDAATLYTRDSGQDERADIARIKAGGGSGDPVSDSLKLTKEIRSQRSQVVGIYGRFLPRDALDALMRDDVEIGAILAKHQGTLDPSATAALNEIAILEMIRKQRYPQWYSQGAPSAGQPQPGPTGAPVQSTTQPASKKNDPAGIR